MLGDLCKELNNWFAKEKQFGKFTIAGGSLNVSGAQEGQYIRIIGSVFNDGVYEYPTKNLKDETFEGSIWLLAIPTEVLKLNEEIEAWKEKYSEVMDSPYQSESFGGYSYTKASTSGSGAVGQSGITWQSTFADRLSHWRKI